MLNDHDALERRMTSLEQRIARLEAILRELLRERSAGGPETVESPQGSSVLDAPTPAAPFGGRPALEDTGEEPAPSRTWHEAWARLPRAGSADRPWSLDLEQWVGQRALLAVGVLALIAGAGFFLSYAFERGWIPPVLRVLGAVVSGIAVTVLGDRLIRRRLRRYGAALAGAGGALAYLGFWAAAARYGLVESRVALVFLGVTAAGVAGLAVRHRIEGLAAWALVGAYLAPVFLTPAGERYETLLFYILAVGAASGTVAYALGWRRTFALAVAGYFLLPGALLVEGLGQPVSVGYLAVGGLVAMIATFWRPWAEARLLAFALAWWFLLAAASRSSLTAHWVGLAGTLGLAGTAWWQHRARDPLARRATGELMSGVEATVFILSPLVLVLWSARGRPPELDWWRIVVPLLAAVAYLGAGWPRRLAHLVGMGFVLLALTAASRWDGPPVTVSWTIIAVLAAAAHRWARQLGGRVVAPGIALFAAVHLFTLSLAGRPPAAPAFADRWAWAWYGVMAGVALAASIWRRRVSDDATRGALVDRRDLGHLVLWALVGATVLLGGSIEVRRVFVSALAADLATSAFWLVYAGALVTLGFTLSVKAIRAAGLAVAGLAVAKIALYDLSSLEALYRVGSLLALALIALAVAFVYHRRARGVAGTTT